MLRLVDKLLRGILVLLAIFMVGTVAWQVFSRFVLQDPSSVTEELARFQLIWLGILGAVYTFGNRMHVGIDIVTQRLTGRRRDAAALFSLTAIAMFAAIMIYGGTALIIMIDRLGQTSAVLGVNLALVYAVVPISGALMILYAARQAAQIIGGGPTPDPVTEGGRVEGPAA